MNRGITLKRKNLFPVFLLLSLVPVYSKAAKKQSPICNTLLSSAAKDVFSKQISAIDNATQFSDLPAVTFLPLPRAQENAIIDYTRRVAPPNFSGKKPIFLLEHYTPENPTTQDTVGMGETIQAMFVEKVLRQIYPDCEIRPLTRITDADDGKTEPIKYKLKENEVHVKIDIGDLSEDLGGGKKISPWHLDMPLLKAANGTLGYLDGPALRASLGIPDDDFVGSLYFKDPNGSTTSPSVYPSVGRVVAEITKIKPLDIIFVSEGGQTHHTNAASSYQQELVSQGYTLVNLSSLQRKDLQGAKTRKIAVVNDLLGKTPYLHAVANLAFIKGPINIFEPLTVKTPVIFMDNSVVHQEYEADTFANMAKIAKATGGGFGIKSTNQISEAFKLSQNVSRNTIVPPYKVKKADIKAPFDLFMDGLYQSIQKQLPN